VRVTHASCFVRFFIEISRWEVLRAHLKCFTIPRENEEVSQRPKVRPENYKGAEYFWEEFPQNFDKYGKKALPRVKSWTLSAECFGKTGLKNVIILVTA
jgi:hypothetical protein